MSKDIRKAAREFIEQYDAGYQGVGEAIEALRAALDAPAQEPTQEQVRKEFVEYIKAQRTTRVFDFTQDCIGRYRDDASHGRWLDWQAAHAAGVAQERERAASEAVHWQRISRPDHKCGEYIAAAILAGKTG